MNILKNALYTLLLMTVSAPALASDYRDAHGVDNKVVYSVYLRNYTNPNAAGTFNDLRKDIPRLKELGIDIIHLLPFYEMGVEHAKGSPYCIRNYRSADPRYGTKEDLKNLVDELHANGMQIWFDWVGNHTAYDHPWVKEHPDWYTERQDFDDVRSVNSRNPELRKAMAADMKYWVDELGIDGYRCDFAHAPGREFWVDIINQVDPDHKLYWLAEANEYGCANDWLRAEGGPFDSRYGWSYAEFMYGNRYDRKADTSRCDLGNGMFHLAYPQDRASFLTYLGSHDIFQGMEPQVSANTQDIIYGNNLKPFTVMTMLAPGLPMVYMGQEINYSKPGGVSIMVDTEAVDWKKVDKDYNQLIKQLIALRHEEPALATFGGFLVNHEADSDSVYVFERRLGDRSVVAMVNLSYNPQTFTVTSPVLPRNAYNLVISDKQQNDKKGKKATKNPENVSLVLADNEITLAPKGYAVYVKQDGKLDAQQYRIELQMPEVTKSPLVSVSTPDPLNVGGELIVAEDVVATTVPGQTGTYVVEIPYLPEFGYDVIVKETTGKEGKQLARIHSDHPSNHRISVASSTLTKK